MLLEHRVDMLQVVVALEARGIAEEVLFVHADADVVADAFDLLPLRLWLLIEDVVQDELFQVVVVAAAAACIASALLLLLLLLRLAPRRSTPPTPISVSCSTSL